MKTTTVKVINSVISAKHLIIWELAEFEKQFSEEVTQFLEEHHEEFTAYLNSTGEVADFYHDANLNLIAGFLLEHVKEFGDMIRDDLDHYYKFLVEGVADGVVDFPNSLVVLTNPNSKNGIEFRIYEEIHKSLSWLPLYLDMDDSIDYETSKVEIEVSDKDALTLLI